MEEGKHDVSAPQGTVRHLTVDERERQGKEARTRAPRSSQAELSASRNRPDPVSLLERQAATRLPELVPIRYGRMLVSPFSFFRGAALVNGIRPGHHTSIGTQGPNLRRCCWVSNDSGHVHLPGIEFDEEQDVGPSQEHRVHGEEVAGQHGRGLSSQERTSGRTGPLR